MQQQAQQLSKDAEEGDGGKDVLANLLGSYNKGGLDDFDKRLGLRTRPTNPMKALGNEFVSPIIRMMRILLKIVRVVVHIFTWKDPYLSCCFLFFLLLTTIASAFFPWREFMFFVGLICLGPQNMFLDSWIQKTSRRKEKQSSSSDGTATTESKDENKNSTGSTATDNEAPNNNNSSTTTKDDEKTNLLLKSSNQMFGNIFNRKVFTARAKSNESDGRNGINGASKTPFVKKRAFMDDIHIPKEPDKVTPRCIFVPYTPLKTDRFYDWPPHPSLARATPVEKVMDLIGGNVSGGQS